MQTAESLGDFRYHFRSEDLGMQTAESLGDFRYHFRSGHLEMQTAESLGDFRYKTNGSLRFFAPSAMGTDLSRVVDCL